MGCELETESIQPISSSPWNYELGFTPARPEPYKITWATRRTCKRFYQISSGRSNRHLWYIFAAFFVAYDEDGLAVYSEALKTARSQGLDIHAAILSNSGLTETSMRLIFHALRMLQRYTPQLASLYVNVIQYNGMAYWLERYILQLYPSPRLGFVRLSLSRASQSLPSTVTDFNLPLGDSNKGSYEIETRGSVLRIELRDPIEAADSEDMWWGSMGGVKSLTLKTTGLYRRYDWSFISSVIGKSPNFRELDARFPFGIEGLPTDLWAPHRPITPASNLQRLILQAKAEAVFALFTAFDFPSLIYLDLIIRGDFELDVGIAPPVASRPMGLHSLRSVVFGYNSKQHIEFLGGFDMPNIESVVLRIRWDSSLGYGDNLLPDQLGGKPKRVTVPIWSTSRGFSELQKLDFSQCETLQLEMADRVEIQLRFQDLSEDSGSRPTIVSCPHLRALRLEISFLELSDDIFSWIFSRFQFDSDAVEVEIMDSVITFTVSHSFGVPEVHRIRLASEGSKCGPPGLILRSCTLPCFDHLRTLELVVLDRKVEDETDRDSIPCLEEFLFLSLAASSSGEGTVFPELEGLDISFQSYHKVKDPQAFEEALQEMNAARKSLQARRSRDNIALPNVIGKREYPILDFDFCMEEFSI